jgi:hypothetical protein
MMLQMPCKNHPLSMTNPTQRQGIEAKKSDAPTYLTGIALSR